ncbi:MAG: hypothetical protein MZU97_01275 [Bacillus subtilis]|nr:hypothetical protein [Bacillus subtilis]
MRPSVRRAARRSTLTERTSISSLDFAGAIQRDKQVFVLVKEVGTINEVLRLVRRALTKRRRPMIPATLKRIGTTCPDCRPIASIISKSSTIEMADGASL